MADDSEAFKLQVRKNVEYLAGTAALKERSTDWIRETAAGNYSYNFTWLGRPIIQFPQDIVALQEIIWLVRPAFIVETGVARGGSLILYASILRLLGQSGRVIGIDIDIRAHNRAAIEAHPLSQDITLIEGSSIDPDIVARVRNELSGSPSVLVILDSNHTHDHVIAELRAYSQFVRKDGYLIVLDTAIADMPAGLFPDRPWGPGNNPKTAVHQFLAEQGRFVIDETYDAKLLITAAPNGYLRCIRDPS
ncbi:MAG: cephalosporin hydroxylase family protein [Rhodobacteraceae bacterium]|nr:cephalosporin hydroxylase family protein [Paracoccaceae bacterium]